MDILYHLGVKNVERSDIAACHRLGKYPGSRCPARVIVKFVNRKTVDSSLYNKGNWKSVRQQMGHSIRLYACLSPKNEEALRMCTWLKNEEVIHDYFIRNGYCMVVENEGDKPYKVHRPQALNDAYGRIPTRR